MEKKWIWSINIFAGLVMLFGIQFFVLQLQAMKWGDKFLDLKVTTLATAIPFLISIGLIMRKKLARRICIDYSWIIGSMMIFSSCIKYVDIKSISITASAVIAITYYLTRPKVKEQFK